MPGKPNFSGKRQSWLLHTHAVGLILRQPGGHRRTRTCAGRLQRKNISAPIVILQSANYTGGSSEDAVGIHPVKQCPYPSAFWSWLTPGSSTFKPAPRLFQVGTGSHRSPILRGNSMVRVENPTRLLIPHSSQVSMKSALRRKLQLQASRLALRSAVQIAAGASLLAPSVAWADCVVGATTVQCNNTVATNTTF